MDKAWLMLDVESENSVVSAWRLKALKDIAYSGWKVHSYLGMFEGTDL